MLNLGIGLGVGSRRPSPAGMIVGRAVRDWKVAANQTIPDLTGRGAALTLNGSPTFVAASGSVPAHYTLNGSSQWLSTGDHADLDFGASEPFTLIVVARIANISGTLAGVIAAKKTAASAVAGYAIYVSSAANRISTGIADGANQPTPVVDLAGQDNLVLPIVLRRTPGTGVQAALNGTWGISVADTTGSLANAEELRFGRFSGAGTSYQAMHFFRALLFRAALSDAELAAILPELVR
jgi:hypothetical protein